MDQNVFDGAVDELPSATFLSPSDVHVLLVDDDRLERMVVSNLLRKCQYKVTVAESGTEAISWLSTSPHDFNILLTDVMMPDMDGITLLRYVKSMPGTQDIAVVMMSANDQNNTVLECIQNGAADYFLKPVTKKDIQHIWQHVWRRMRAVASDYAARNAPAMPTAGGAAGAAGVAAGAASDDPRPGHDGTVDAGLPEAPDAHHDAASYRGAARGRGGTEVAASERQAVPGIVTRDVAADAMTHCAADEKDCDLSSWAAQVRCDSVWQGGAGSIQGDGLARKWMTLRGWMQRQQGRSPRDENLFVFHRTLQLVAKAHAQQTHFNLRPARLVISDSLEVSQIEELGSSADILVPAEAAAVGRAKQGLATAGCSGGTENIPWTEDDRWYESPEERTSADAATCASDMYSAGVLLFELIHAVQFSGNRDVTERQRLMLDLKHRVLPQKMLLNRPRDCALLLLLLHPDPDFRPTARDVLNSDLILNGVDMFLRRAGDAIVIPDADKHLLLTFLKTIRAEMQKRCSVVDRQLKVASHDLIQLDTVHGLGSRASVDRPRAGVGLAERHSASTSAAGQPPKRKLGDMQGGSHASTSNVLGLGSVPPQHAPNQAVSMHYTEWRKERIAGAQTVLENPYFARRFDGRGDLKRDAMGELERFAGDLMKFSRYGSFDVLATICNPNLSSSHMICSMDYDRDSEYFATAGVDRRIKLYDLNAVLSCDVDFHYPVLELECGAKISCVKWNTYIKSNMISSNYDGVIQLWDASTGQMSSELIEHRKRVWTLHFNSTDPMRFASGSDDGTVKIWSINQQKSVMNIRAKANVCCVNFNPNDAYTLCFGCADYKAYCYDIRNPSRPACVFGSHSKAVSYVCHMNADECVTASTDNSLCRWNVKTAVQRTSNGVIRPECSYSGHVNEKNFVGLTMNEDYIFCGSEDGDVVGYFKECSTPILRHNIRSGMTGDDALQVEYDPQIAAHQFVSCVLYNNKLNILLAASSIGLLKALKPVT